MKPIVPLLALALCACGRQAADQAEQSPAPAPAATPTAPMQSAMLDVPKDPAELRKIQAMGYTVHDDHLHAPGVTTCPKAGDGPVM